MSDYSPLKSANLSLVCFTRNDHDLLNRNLSGLLKWSVLPKEIIVVDDASGQTYHPSQALSAVPEIPAIKVIRTPHNLGYSGAKNLGLQQAGCRFIMSMDADISPASNWLELCLPHAARPKTGMVSGPIIADCGSHLFGQYMALTYSLNKNIEGETKFIPGAIWLMRRDVWLEMGGYTNYPETAGEDDYLCRQLKQAGYALWLEPQAKAVENRPMTRLQMAVRGWQWHGASIYKALSEGRPIQEAVNVLVYSVRPRILRSKQANPLYLYYDLLYLSHALFDLLRNIPTADYLLASFQPWLAPYPALASALTADLNTLGFSWAHKFLLEKTLVAPHPDNDIAKALAFAFDQTTLDTLNMNLDIILESLKCEMF